MLNDEKIIEYAYCYEAKNRIVSVRSFNEECVNATLDCAKNDGCSDASDKIRCWSQSSSVRLTTFNMMFRILLAFCLFSTAASVTLVICQQSYIPNGTILNERFVIERQLGAWYGERCYHGRDSQNNKQIVLKAFLPADPRIQAYVDFFKECSGMQGIPTFLAHFSSYETHEYNGVLLRGILNARMFHISLENTIRLGYRLFKILHAIHLKGYVHKNIQPLSITCDVGPDGHANPYAVLTPQTMWLGDLYLQLEEMRADRLSHLQVMAALRRAVPGFDPQTAITYPNDVESVYHLID
ncbi:hypothetical protein L3Y34_011476 [Caenorhabditis briggsae]|uniref:Protein kinase domain-containing protein n=1 Tax=Caenorhabditis briggsae TaxID=6238 RepID=A0AAE8ZWD1_CAEBR|nr:hypothetical protein L3Y34_011476 [Caenorhabditis briggsae]